ncbi:hypothetical protein EJ08DRAFT_697578 [Tothia fuscella]|uniref:Uncharacterized protein n=1 Tax=Tothia fuscella TaxID=1048955 RepID=A0A9P4NRG1_9PEZI|nr:hypothetical protein EJ08DRAFT_697578 [Tothia fuscella]
MTENWLTGDVLQGVEDQMKRLVQKANSDETVQIPANAFLDQVVSFIDVLREEIGSQGTGDRHKWIERYEKLVREYGQGKEVELDNPKRIRSIEITPAKWPFVLTDGDWKTCQAIMRKFNLLHQPVPNAVTLLDGLLHLKKNSSLQRIEGNRDELYVEGVQAIFVRAKAEGVNLRANT